MRCLFEQTPCIPTCHMRYDLYVSSRPSFVFVYALLWMTALMHSLHPMIVHQYYKHIKFSTLSAISDLLVEETGKNQRPVASHRHTLNLLTCKLWGRVIVFNNTFNNILAIFWRLNLLVEELGKPRENYRPASSNL